MECDDDHVHEYCIITTRHTSLRQQRSLQEAACHVHGLVMLCCAAHLVRRTDERACSADAGSSLDSDALLASVSASDSRIMLIWVNDSKCHVRAPAVDKLVNDEQHGVQALQHIRLLHRVAGRVIASHHNMHTPAQDGCHGGVQRGKHVLQDQLRRVIFVISHENIRISSLVLVGRAEDVEEQVDVAAVHGGDAVKRHNLRCGNYSLNKCGAAHS